MSFISSSLSFCFTIWGATDRGRRLDILPSLDPGHGGDDGQDATGGLTCLWHRLSITLKKCVIKGYIYIMKLTIGIIIFLIDSLYVSCFINFSKFHAKSLNYNNLLPFSSIPPSTSSFAFDLKATPRGLGAGAIIAENKKASNNQYEFDFKIEAGIQLIGTEAKACRQAGNVILGDGLADVIDGQVYLCNVHIGTAKRTPAREDHSPKRNRKLLLHAKEILKIEQRVLQQNYEVVPIKMYFSDKNFVKVELGIGKQKSVIDKRQDMQKKDANRDIRRAMKNF